MASRSASPDVEDKTSSAAAVEVNNVLSCFNNPRTCPPLPEPFTWPTLLANYCPAGLPDFLASPKRQDLPRHPYGFIFCHRGYYDRANKVPENSNLSIRNGCVNDLILHEIDVRLKGARLPGSNYVAHDEVAGRVTGDDERWSGMLTKARMEKVLLARQDFDPVNMELVGRHGDVGDDWGGEPEKVPGVDDLIWDSIDPVRRGVMERRRRRSSDGSGSGSWVVAPRESKVEEGEEQGSRSEREGDVQESEVTRSDDGGNDIEESRTVTEAVQAPRKTASESSGSNYDRPPPSNYSIPNSENDFPKGFLWKRGCLQLDLKGDDFPRLLAFYQGTYIENERIMLKGYNYHFPSLKSVIAAAEVQAAKQLEAYETYPKPDIVQILEGQATYDTFSWHKYPWRPHVFIVFDAKPIIARALEIAGIGLEISPEEARLNLSYSTIHAVAREQVFSFITDDGPQVIPEITHSGLGLGYNISSGEALNPINGDAIADREMILQARADRALIEVSLELRDLYPKLYFSSCTRLCEVRSADDGREWVASMSTGKLMLKPTGEKGIVSELRSMHGGLYPRTDFVVADDPLAEIAARTWIDEVAGLDRRQLYPNEEKGEPGMCYNEWIRQAGPLVEKAIRDLNGPFLPNTVSGKLKGSSWNITAEEVEKVEKEEEYIMS